MNTLLERLLFIGIGIVACLVIIAAVKFLVSKKVVPLPSINTDLDQQALKTATEALLNKAKAQADSDLQMQKISEIEKIADPAEKLKQLSDMLKGV